MTYVQDCGYAATENVCDLLDVYLNRTIPSDTPTDISKDIIKYVVFGIAPFITLFYRASNFHPQINIITSSLLKIRLNQNFSIM